MDPAGGDNHQLDSNHVRHRPRNPTMVIFTGILRLDRVANNDLSAVFVIDS